MSSNISIRFNAASMLEDSDDDDILCGSPKDALHFEVHKAPEPEVHPVTASPAPADAGVNGCDGDDKPDKVESRDGAAEGKVNGEGVTNGTPVKEDKSLFGGLKERFSDKIDPLAAFFNEKIEDFTANDKSDNKDAEEKDDKIANQTSAKSGKSIKSDSRTPSVDSTQNSECNEDVSINGSQPGSPLCKTTFDLQEESVENDTIDELANITHCRPTPIAKSLSADQIISMSGLLSNQKPSTENLLECDAPVYPEPSISTTYVAPPNVPDPVVTHKSGTSQTSVPWLKVLFVLPVVLCCIFVPLSTFTYGMLLGVMLSTIVFRVYLWLYRCESPVEPLRVPDMENASPLLVPNMKIPAHTDGTFKGWMNELKQYNVNDYHINQTSSVFVTLDGRMLRLQRPKTNIPRRVAFDDGHINASFIHQRHFNLEGSQICLLPTQLVKKRLWSKKYPICIALANVDFELKEDDELSSTLVNGLADGLVDEDKQTLLYLFARTGREKEEWYRRFYAAAQAEPLPVKISDLLSETAPKVGSSSKMIRQGSLDSNLSLTSATLGTLDLPDIEDPVCVNLPHEKLAEYLSYMSHVVPADSIQRLKPGTFIDQLTLLNQDQCDSSIMFVNAVIGRLFWDFLQKNYWAAKMTEKIQRKLSKIHVPYFIDELTVTDINLGNQLPLIQQLSKAYIDDRGLWIDANVVYNGGFVMSLETKVNLMKLKKTSSDTGIPVAMEPVVDMPLHRSPVTNSDEEDSAESSSEEDEDENTVELAEEQPTGGRGTGKKLLRIVDKITQSRYFQQATENKYIKKAMKGVSDTPIALTVELKRVIGTVAINIPPPPTDRIWYGFRENPKLLLSAKPKVGERAVTVSHVTEWIEKKLKIEFQRVLVMPNMDDLVIPLMCDDLDS